jgi:hypothetical protein
LRHPYTIIAKIKYISDTWAIFLVRSEDVGKTCFSRLLRQRCGQIVALKSKDLFQRYPYLRLGRAD